MLGKCFKVHVVSTKDILLLTVFLLLLTLYQLGKLCFDRGDYTRLTRILKQLHLSCQTEQGEDDMKKGTQLLEVYALEIQMYTEQKNNQKLKALYEQSLHIKSAIPHPLIMGVIRGMWGQPFLTPSLWGSSEV